MNTSDLDIDALLKRLHLANARRAWRDLVTRVEAESWSCRDFLAILVAEGSRIASRPASSGCLACGSPVRIPARRRSSSRPLREERSGDLTHASTSCGRPAHRGALDSSRSVSHTDPPLGAVDVESSASVPRVVAELTLHVMGRADERP